MFFLGTWELLHHRCKWYETIIKQMLQTIGISLVNLKFVRGTTYQLQERYSLDVYKMSALVTTQHTKHAGAEVVKQTENPQMSNLLYPILQALGALTTQIGMNFKPFLRSLILLLYLCNANRLHLDEEYLGVDIQFGGVDQRKIFMFAREWMPKVGYRKRAYIMNSLIPGLGKSGKMSSSEPNSKIELHELPNVIRKKIREAFSVDGRPQENGLLAILQHILFRYLIHKNEPFFVSRCMQCFVFACLLKILCVFNICT